MDNCSKILIGLLGFTSLAGYVMFHGHRLGKDCCLCSCRGLAFIGGSLTLGGVIVILDNQ